MHNGKDLCNSSSVTEHMLHVRPAGRFFRLSGSVGSVLSGCGMALVRHCLRTLWMEMLLNTITDHPLSVADKLFSPALQERRQGGPCCWRGRGAPEERRQRDLRAALDVGLSASTNCTCGGFALDVMSTPIKWINLLRWGRCKSRDWVGSMFVCLVCLLSWCLLFMLLCWADQWPCWYKSDFSCTHTGAKVCIPVWADILCHPYY